MTTEFDQYATEYSKLLRDPLRDWFGATDMFFHLRKWLVIQDLLNRQGLAPSKLKWLDVGCGQGQLLNLGCGSFKRAAGCDPSVQMIRSCTARAVYSQPSPTELPFADASFDFLTAVCVYHHVHGGDRELLTKSVRRVLKPGGLFCLIEHNPWNPVTQLIVRRCPIDEDAELLSMRQVTTLMQGGGFTVLDSSYFLYLTERLFDRFGKSENLLRRCPMGGQFAVLARKPGGVDEPSLTKTTLSSSL